MDVTAYEDFIRQIGGADFETVYVIDGDELPSHLQVPDCRAYTGPLVDLAAKEFLADRWAGRGFGVVVYPARIAEDASPYVRLDYQTQAILLHEMAHRCQALYRLRGLSGLCELPTEQQTIDAAEVAFQLSAPISDPIEPWTGHEPLDFGRAAIHLVYRASVAFLEDRIAMPISLTDTLAFGPHYGTGDQYFLELGDEPALRKNEKISEILATDAPIEFTRLFQNDRARWHENNKREQHAR
jgi:hypothetical protein